MAMTNAQAAKHILAAQRRVNEEIANNAKGGGRYASALANEGYAGGYSQALRDVILLFNGCKPNTRNYWGE